MKPFVPLRQRFAVGTQFRSSGKHPHLCTVTDYHVTTNRAGEIVKCRYVATHEFMGQTITDYDVCETNIARNLISEPSSIPPP